MKKVALLLLFAFLGGSALRAQVPDTPAGRQFSAWRRAQDSADRAIIQQFIETHMPWGRADQELAIRNRTGGFEVKKVEESTDARLVVLAQERSGGQRLVRITLTVASGEPHSITGLRIQPAESGPAPAPRRMTESEMAAARAGVPYAQFSAWLEAFNDSDPSRLRRFLEASYPSANAEALLNFRGRTGGLELRGLEQATATTLTGLVQERASDQFGRFTITVESDEPHRITQLPIRAIPRPAEFPIAPMSEAELVAALSAKIEKDATADTFSGAVIVARKGEVLFSGAFGLADREKNVANTLDTRFRIGSMNKMFTGASILQLVQAGRIALTDPLGKLVTDYPNGEVATKVTIHHLLTHTGGTGDIFGPEFKARRLELRTLGDYVSLYGERGLAFEPGSRWAYSNYGMVLLGVVIERVSGQSYYDYVSEHIYKPAGMTGSGSQPESDDVPERCVGYMRAPGGGWTPNTDTLPYRGTSAGGGYSTVRDLIKFADALLNHRLLNAEYTQLLITGNVDIGGGERYAYGFGDRRKDGEGDVGHAGGAPGMNGDLRIYPKSGYVVAVLSNLDPPAAQRVSTFVDLRLPR